jgi:hypothetical protein
LINEDSRNQLSKDGKSKGTEKKESSAESAWQSAHEQLTSDSERLSSAVPGQPSDLPPKNVVGEHGVDSKHHLNEDNGQRASLAISKGKNNQQPPVSSAESQRNDLNEQSNAEFPHQPEVTAAHEDEQLHKHGKELETNSNIARKHRSESTYKRSASHLVKRHGKQSELSDRNDLEQKTTCKTCI